jgi:peptidylprolyl isomerase
MRRVGLLFVCGALLLVGCGGGGGGSASPNETPTVSLSAGPSPSPGGGTDTIGGSVSANVGHKPTISLPKGTAPTTLLTQDIVAGHGQVVGEGSTVTAHLVGLHWTTGKPFYSSYDKADGKPDRFSLIRVIPGFAQGVSGMLVGGRREIVVPPDLAYGAKGSQQVAPNETLVYVVDLISLG